jgi:hypothetical protein
MLNEPAAPLFASLVAAMPHLWCHHGRDVVAGKHMLIKKFNCSTHDTTLQRTAAVDKIRDIAPTCGATIAGL